jgi:D-arabinono-1,4-lactone oxidase
MNIETLSVNGATYFLPKNIDEVSWLVNQAIVNNEVICVRGAAHSFPLIGTLEKGPTSGRKYVYIMLSYMYNVHIVGNTVTVDAGCHLGPDPWDPKGISTLNNSLLKQLDDAGLAIPDLGGITHQTVGGFLSTASSGGSTKYSFEDALMSVDIVTCEGGTATLKTFSRPNPDNPDDAFYGAAIASMGLFGVIVSATFKCVPKFFIAGDEATTLAVDCEIDLFGNGSNGKPSLQTFFAQTDYTRLMWWPQEKVQKMVVWKAHQTDEQGAENWAANAYQKMGKQPPASTKLKPYQEVPYIGNSATPSTLGADFLFSAIGRWPGWLQDIMGNTLEYQLARDAIDKVFYPYVLPKVLDIFVQIDTPTNANRGPQLFSDVWFTGLPMDNQMSDKLMPVWFTELWIDINQSQKVMNDLLNFYNASTDNTGAFSCEIYPAKSNEFWLSPSYQQDVIRIDVFWFANNTGDPTAFYQKFWDLLAPYQFRPHWGKYLPDPGWNVVNGVPYLHRIYPKFSNWKNLRDQMDPKQVFVNDYWRSHLSIPDPA